MNIKIIALLMLISAVVFSGCKKIDNALDVTFDATLSTDLNIDVPASTKAGVNGNFLVFKTIDPTADENVEKYIDKIKSWEVTEVTAEILSVSEDVNLVHLNFNVTNEVHSTVWSFHDIIITKGTLLTLDNDNGQWDTINTILGEKEVITIMVSGETEQGNVQFTIRFKIKSKVTANPL